MRPPHALLRARLMTTMRPSVGGGQPPVGAAPGIVLAGRAAGAAATTTTAPPTADGDVSGGVLARPAARLPTIPAGPAAAPTGPVVRHLCPPSDIPSGGLAAYLAGEVGVTEVCV
jgi:hypothetical protein